MSSVSDPTQAPKVSRIYDGSVNVFPKRSIFHKPDGSVEVEIVSDFLKEARTQVLNSTDLDKQSKELLDALVQIKLDECCALPEERDCYSQLVSAKDHSYIGPSPT